MRRLILTILGLAIILVFPNFTYAQMMNWNSSQTGNSPSAANIREEQNMQNDGQKVWQDLQSGKISCSKLTNKDYEELGEYFMGQSAGSTENHVYWDQRIQQMMGENGDSQMHIAWGERGSGCLSNAPFPSNTPSFLASMMSRGGVNDMMWGYGTSGNWSGFGILGSLVWLVVLVDFILLGIWLWKQIQKK